MKPNLYNLPARYPSYATFIASFSGRKPLFFPAILLLLATVLLLGVGCNRSNDNSTVAENSNIIESPPPGIPESNSAPATASSNKPNNSNAGYTDYAEEEEEKQPTRKQPRREEPTAPIQETQPVRQTTYTTSTSTNTNTYTEPRPPTTTPLSPSGFTTPATGSSGNPNLNSTPPPPATSVVMTPTTKPTPPPAPEKTKTPEPAGVFVSLNEKNQLKKELESAFESAEGKQFKNFSLQNRFANPTDEKCITGSFLDNYDKNFSLYTYFGRMRQESYDIVVEDLTFNDEGKIVQVKVKEKAKLNKAEN